MSENFAAVDWRLTGPVVIEDVLPRWRCDALRSLIETQGARPRSFQGLVDPAVRECGYICTDWSAVPELGQLLSDRIQSAFCVRASAAIEAQLMVYRYGPGVGFVPHHDEVTALELERAATNGQPVIAGDLTIVALLSDPDEYTGGQLFFPDFETSFKPRAGTAVVFPATRAFVHGIAPIASGARFSCVARCFVDEDETAA